MTRSRIADLLAATLVVLAASVAVSALGMQNAWATTCDTAHNLQIGNASNKYAGTQPMIFEGVYAELDPTATIPSLCTTDTNGGVNFASAWIMLFGSDGQSYDQVGTIYRYGYSCQKWWSEVAKYGDFTDFYLSGCIGSGTAYHLHVYPHQTSTGVFVLYSSVNTSVVHITQFDPFNTFTYPFQVAFDGETYHAVSDVPGVSGDPTEFANMQVQDYATDLNHSTCGNAILPGFNDNPTHWGRISYSCNDTAFWSN